MRETHRPIEKMVMNERLSDYRSVPVKGSRKLPPITAVLGQRPGRKVLFGSVPAVRLFGQFGGRVSAGMPHQSGWAHPQMFGEIRLLSGQLAGAQRDVDLIRQQAHHR